MALRCECCHAASAELNYSHQRGIVTCLNCHLCNLLCCKQKAMPDTTEVKVENKARTKF